MKMKMKKMKSVIINKLTTVKFIASIITIFVIITFPRFNDTFFTVLALELVVRTRYICYNKGTGYKIITSQQRHQTKMTIPQCEGDSSDPSLQSL